MSISLMSYSFWVNYINSWFDISEMSTFVRYLKLPTIHVNAISITQTCLSCPKSNCLPFKQLLINWQRSLTLLLQYPWLCYNSVFLDNTFCNIWSVWVKVNLCRFILSFVHAAISVVFFVFFLFKWEVICSFGGIADHHCVNSLFVMLN
jgi:hypothetical protein